MKSGRAWAPFRYANSLRDLLPLLHQLRPEAVRQVEAAAAQVWDAPPEQRPATREAARASVAALRGVAIAAAERLAVQPPGPPGWEARQAKAKAYLDAQVKSLDLLLRMLEDDTAPDPRARMEWEESRQEVDKLLEEAK